MESVSLSTATSGLAFLSGQSFQWRTLAAVTAIKFLLVPSYRSTDFEVHRNWMALTSSLPVSEWYTNTVSEWTLDYPPLFAWFEWSLAQLARTVDPAMLEVENHNYASNATVCFQRGSVILADAVLASGAWYATRRLSRVYANLTFFLIVCHPGLLIVDHIHFQYNGLLLGLLLWSLGAATEGKDLLSGLLFAILVNMKHLYATLGPVYAVYLLRRHCRGERAAFRMLLLGSGVLTVCAVSFGPFVALGQLQQVLARLFPFGRGLCHAYWAANVWALYAGLDKGMAFLFRALKIPIKHSVASMAGGLVGVAKFAVLPDVPPAVTILMYLAALLPVLLRIWRTPNAVVFVRAIAYAALSSFMLGYHVHEKAALTAVVVAALGATASRRTAGTYLFLSTTATHALYPLLFTAAEYPVKVALLVSYTLLAALFMLDGVVDGARAGAAGMEGQPSALLRPLETLYLGGLAAVEVYGTWLHPHLLGDRLPFLPLMVTSMYCAAGMVHAWAQPELWTVHVEKRD